MAVTMRTFLLLGGRARSTTKGYGFLLVPPLLPKAAAPGARFCAMPVLGRRFFTISTHLSQQEEGPIAPLPPPPPPSQTWARRASSGKKATRLAGREAGQLHCLPVRAPNE